MAHGACAIGVVITVLRHVTRKAERPIRDEPLDGRAGMTGVAAAVRVNRRAVRVP
jgi:hypothetical protein